ncbi:FAD-dependent oxidoreductase [Phaeovulum sp. NW3]|uniref:FAD-dependent oxidoreductase n=1 Tax=Phaeovulum sp. NW3 TaxID=2934933 RepID=UPI0020205A87|nr:FAD-dependent oxidoreductase [Phaeovulum sp. NW3]MCL7466627.1 FAD-dependent oxidoreductase [Phaeovulum sp. NW3]
MNRRPRIAIAGAGAAGLTATFAAARAGAEVLLVERSDGSQSNLAIGGGLIAAAGTPAQAAAGIDDSPARWRADIDAATGSTLPEGLVTCVTAGAAPALALIEAVCGDRFGLVEGGSIAGHSRPRLHELGDRSGPALAALMLQHAAALPGVQLLRDTPAEGLAIEAGRVTGINLAGRTERVDAVILASGGFGAAADLVARHIPALRGALHIGSPTNLGDALRWTEALGIEGMFLEGYQGHGHATVDGMGRLGIGLTSMGAMLVDTTGRRFVREDTGPSAMAAHVLACPGGRAIEIWSEPQHARFLHFAAYRDCISRGAVGRFDTLEALAAAHGLPEAALARSLAEFNAAAAETAADPLGRVSHGAPLAPPFWAAAVTGALAHTQGGLPIDAAARVIGPAGRPVPGLYAAGGAALGLTGAAPEGYLSGNGLGHAVALGAIAGAAAAGAAA